MTAPAGTAKGRTLATLAELAAAVERMPEASCALLEQAGVVRTLRAQVETLANATAAVTAVAPFVADVQRGFRALSELGARVRRR